MQRESAKARKKFLEYEKIMRHQKMISSLIKGLFPLIGNFLRTGTKQKDYFERKQKVFCS